MTPRAPLDPRSTAAGTFPEAGGRTPSSLRRFLGYVRPYRVLIAVAAVCGVVRYVIPMVLPWTLKMLVDDFFRPGSLRPHSQLHLLMGALCGLYALYAVISYFLRHRSEVESYLRQGQKEAEAVRRENESRFDPQGIRDRLLARRPARS